MHFNHPTWQLRKKYISVAYCFFFWFQRALFVISISVFTASVIGLGAIVSAKPLDALGYKGWDADNSFYSPYATSMYLGWALSSTIAVITTGLIPIVAWFATYRFSPSSAICVGLFASTFILILFFQKNYFECWIEQIAAVLSHAFLQLFLCPFVVHLTGEW